MSFQTKLFTPSVNLDMNIVHLTNSNSDNIHGTFERTVKVQPVKHPLKDGYEPYFGAQRSNSLNCKGGDH